MCFSMHEGHPYGGLAKAGKDGGGVFLSPSFSSPTQKYSTVSTLNNVCNTCIVYLYIIRSFGSECC